MAETSTASVYCMNRACTSMWTTCCNAPIHAEAACPRCGQAVHPADADERWKLAYGPFTVKSNTDTTFPKAPAP